MVGCLSSCANSNLGDNLQRSLAPDPQLKDRPVTFNQQSSATPKVKVNQVKLPDDFPKEIPLYPDAELIKVEQNGKLTTWKSDVPINLIESFYQQKLSEGKWQVLPSKKDAENIFTATKDQLQVKIDIKTALLIIEYNPNLETAQKVPVKDDKSTEKSTEKTPEKPPEKPKNTKNENLPQYVTDILSLKIVDSKDFQVNKIITRREYARLLVTINNKYYEKNTGKQIKLIAESKQPAFQDIKPTDVDFAVIQGLAEAGLIPSNLTGDSTTVLFRPDAPLTRENLILWKVPLDTRQPLPNANIEAVKQTWGFQDSGKIEPKALKAILADFQNGDKSNIKRFLGFTTIFQPQKPVTYGEAIAVLWYFGTEGEGTSAQDILKGSQ
jgi:S-layer homology domain